MPAGSLEQAAPRLEALARAAGLSPS
jgi:hypothetical protein